MKIALLTNGVYPFVIGGMQKHSYFLAKYFAKNQLYVDVFHPGGKIKEEINISDFFTKEELRYLAFIEIPFPKIKTFPGHYILSSYLYSKALYNHLALCKEENKFIYAQGFTSWYFLKKQNFQQNLISNLHGLEMFQCTINLKNRLEQILLKIPASFIIKKSNKQISLGGKLTNILYKNGGKPNLVVEIPNAIESNWVINESAFKSENSTQRIKFVFIGRYERRKGIEEFHEVIQKTIDILNYEVNFIGPIPEEKQFKHKNVNYLGAIMESDKIKEVLINSDILVCPSYSEGMPTVILEAMACGCAIIATDVGATSTIVNVDNGWLLKGDIVSNLHTAILSATSCSSEELIFKKKQSIQKVLKNFTWKKVIQKTIKSLEI
jgi:glycosyltransferase involved in cell wall biosynthesis